MLKEAGVAVYFERRLKDVTKDGARITLMRAENGDSFQASVFVDATYEGDLLAAAGVSYTVGREGDAKYGETHNGVFFGPGHTFSVKVDPYKEEGKKESGLLWGISPEPPAAVGQGDKKVQAYNFRMWLTDAADRLPFPKPAGYDRDRYALLLRYLNKQPKPAMPFQLDRGDCNNNGGFSTDYIGGSRRLAGSRLRHARKDLSGSRQLSAGPDVVHGQRPRSPRGAAVESPRLRPAEGRVPGDRRLAA